MSIPYTLGKNCLALPRDFVPRVIRALEAVQNMKIHALTFDVVPFGAGGEGDYQILAKVETRDGPRWTQLQVHPEVWDDRGTAMLVGGLWKMASQTEERH